MSETNRQTRFGLKEHVMRQTCCTIRQNCLDLVIVSLHTAAAPAVREAVKI